MRCRIRSSVANFRKGAGLEFCMDGIPYDDDGERRLESERDVSLSLDGIFSDWIAVLMREVPHSDSIKSVFILSETKHPFST